MNSTEIAQAAEAECFLDKIIREPDDDTHRLVYADWLDEHDGLRDCVCCGGTGKLDADHRSGTIECRVCWGGGTRPNHFAARAEFIRVQCELASIRRDYAIHGAFVAPPAVHINRLGTREQSLCETYDADWFPRKPLRPHRLTADVLEAQRGIYGCCRLPPGRTCDCIQQSITHEYSRGFVSKLRMPLTVFDSVLTSLTNTQKLKLTVYERHPIARVCLTDRESAVGETGRLRGHWWFGPSVPGRCGVSAKVFARMRAAHSGAIREADDGLCFETGTEAHDALEAACAGLLADAFARAPVKAP